MYIVCRVSMLFLVCKDGKGIIFMVHILHTWLEQTSLVCIIQGVPVKGKGKDCLMYNKVGYVQHHVLDGFHGHNASQTLYLSYAKNNCSSTGGCPGYTRTNSHSTLARNFFYPPQNDFRASRETTESRDTIFLKRGQGQNDFS